MASRARATAWTASIRRSQQIADVMYRDQRGQRRGLAGQARPPRQHAEGRRPTSRSSDGEPARRHDELLALQVVPRLRVEYNVFSRTRAFYLDRRDSPPHRQVLPGRVREGRRSAVSRRIAQRRPSSGQRWNRYQEIHGLHPVHRAVRQAGRCVPVPRRLKDSVARRRHRRARERRLKFSADVFGCFDHWPRIKLDRRVRGAALCLRIAGVDDADPHAGRSARSSPATPTFRSSSRTCATAAITSSAERCTSTDEDLGDDDPRLRRAARRAAEPLGPSGRPRGAVPRRRTRPRSPGWSPRLRARP